MDLELFYDNMIRTDIPEDILEELNLSTLTPFKISLNRLRVDRNTIFLVIPDININMYKDIHGSGFLLSNSLGIVTRNSILRLFNKQFNGLLHYKEMRKSFSEEKIKGSKRLLVLNNFRPQDLDNENNKETPKDPSITRGSFYFYDLSLYTKGLEVLLKRTSERMATVRFMKEISNLYADMNINHSDKNIELLFLVKNKEGILYSIIKHFNELRGLKTFKELELFDNFGLVSNTRNVIFPILGKVKNQTVVFIPNLKKFEKYVDAEDVSEKINSETLSDLNTDNVNLNKENVKLEKIKPFVPLDKNIIRISKKNSIFDKMVDNLKDNKLQSSVDQDGNVSIGLNEKSFKDTLSKFKIDDPLIVNNIKGALDSYIEHSKQNNKSVKNEDIYNIVLKTMNTTIHQTDEVDDEYIKNPDKLVKKIANLNNHRVDLNLPESENTNINPTDIVDIKYTTAAWRNKYEFDEIINFSIEKLFESLTNRFNNPIKIKNIKHEIVDDDLNRFRKYTITLQNSKGDGFQQPYSVELNVPSPVNDRYFKINGSRYIMSTQHFMKPLTKTNINEVRFLTNFSMVTLSVQNLKYNTTEITDIINYIKSRYNGLITNKDVSNKVTFSDNSELYFTGSLVYKDKYSEVGLDPTSNKLKDEINDKYLNIGKNEYIYEILLNKIALVNSKDRLTKTGKSIPYIRMYIGGKSIPLIIYLWSMKGLLTTLQQLDIEYEQVSEYPTGDAQYVITMQDNNKYIVIRPKNIRERLFCNGLLSAKIKQNFKSVENTDEINDFIEWSYGPKSVYNLRTVTNNIVDPVTMDLLKFDNMPTNLPDILAGPALKMLLNADIEKLSDMKLYRSRMAEVVLGIMYEQLMQGHSYYSEKVRIYSDTAAKFYLDTNYIIKELITTSGVLQETSAVNPIEEIFLSSKTIKTGPGGVPTNRAFKTEHRNIHPSQLGTLSAVATSEDSNVGIVVSHTLTPAIVNEYGSYGVKDASTLKPWDTVSINESLTPFQNEMDSDRLIMATKHAIQVTPTDSNEPPLVGTGAEFIVPQISSSRFVHRAKKDGTIVEIVKDKTMTIKYKDGSFETLDILPRLSRTKMAQFLLLNMEPLKLGTKVKADQVVAATKNFKQGMYASGKNVFIAIMNYMGHGHEDAYCVSEELSKSMSRDIIKELYIIIPPGTKVIHIEKEMNKKITESDHLIEFVYPKALDEYLEINNMKMSDDEDEDNEIKESIISKTDDKVVLNGIDGEIVDIKVYINNKNSIDRQIVLFHNELVRDTNNIIKKLEQGTTTDEERQNTRDNLDLNFIKTSGHKIKGIDFMGALIKYRVRQKKPLLEGDKIAARYGTKGVISKVFSNEDPPRTKTCPKIDVFLPAISVLGRKNIAVIKELYLGKVLYFLNQKVKDMIHSNEKSEKILSLVDDIYKLICPTNEIYESTIKKIKSFKEQDLFKMILDDEFTFRLFIPPFATVSFENVKTAADLLNIPLDEKVYIPELGEWTKTPVPVGVSYYNALEQTSEIYSNVRSTGKYQSLSGQATRGKSNEGGQAIGNLDVYAFLGYNTPAVLEELLTLRSDDHKSKRQVINQIIQNGEADLPSKTGGGATSSMWKVFMECMGLKIKA